MVTGAPSSLLREPVVWRSEGVLLPGDALWQTVLGYGTNAVVLQRSLGLGSVVLCTDSYFLSNEGLRSNPAPEFLSWLVGAVRRVVFDEAHLGIQESPGVASLARRYRLELPFLTFCVLAALVVWRRSSSFAPRVVEREGREDIIRGRDIRGGFVGLLRRNIAPQDLLTLCLQEWKHSRFGGRTIASARLTRVQDIINRENQASASRPDPVRVYQEIATVLSDRVHFQPVTEPQPPLLNDH